MSTALQLLNVLGPSGDRRTLSRFDAAIAKPPNSLLRASLLQRPASCPQDAGCFFPRCSSATWAWTVAAHASSSCAPMPSSPSRRPAACRRDACLGQFVLEPPHLDLKHLALKASRHRKCGPGYGGFRNSWRCYGRFRNRCCGFRTASVTDPRPVALTAGSAFRGFHRSTRVKGVAKIWGTNRYRYLTQFNPASPRRGSPPPRAPRERHWMARKRMAVNAILMRLRPSASASA